MCCLLFIRVGEDSSSNPRYGGRIFFLTIIHEINGHVFSIVCVRSVDNTLRLWITYIIMTAIHESPTTSKLLGVQV